MFSSIRFSKISLFSSKSFETILCILLCIIIQVLADRCNDNWTFLFIYWAFDKIFWQDDLMTNYIFILAILKEERQPVDTLG